MKIVFPLFSHFTGKKILFPCLGEIYFDGLLGEKILREANIQKGWHKLEEKWLSFVVFEHIGAWFSFYVWWEFYNN